MKTQKIYSTAYGKKLVRSGKARDCGIITHDGRQYAVIERLDTQETAHYKL